MEPKLITRRERLGQLNAGAFAGRQGELSLLDRALTDPQELGFINIHGISGIGKTSLVEQFVVRAREHQCITCYVDLVFSGSRIALLNKLSQSLTAPLLADTENACLAIKNRYRDIHAKLHSTNAVSRSVLNQISRLFDLCDGISEPSTDPSAQLLTSTDIAMSQRALGSDYDFFVDPSSALARALVLDINSIASRRASAILIALDHSEKVDEDLLAWLRNNVLYDLSELVVVVAAGQRPLVDGWEELLQLGASIELEPLTQSETFTLASKSGVYSQPAREWIYEACRGVPLFAAALCRAYANDPSVVNQHPQAVSPSESMMERYFSAIAPDDRELLLQGAVFRYVSAENAEAVLGTALMPQLLTIMGRLSCVRETPQGFVIHDRVRDYLNRYYLKHNPTRFMAISNTAAEYYRNRRNRGIRVLESTVEELYHAVRSHGAGGLELLKEAFSKYSLLNESRECEALLRSALLAGLESSDWTALFRAVISYQRADYRVSRNILDRLLSSPTLSLDKELKGLAFFYYSVISWYLCDFPKSLKYSTLAVNILEDSASELLVQPRRSVHLNRAIGIIGLTQYRLGSFADSIVTADRMVDAARASGDPTSLGYALNSRGYFSWEEGDWCKADKFFSESIDVWAQLGSDFGACFPLGHRARLRNMIGDPAFDAEVLKSHLQLAIDCANIEMQYKMRYNYAEALWDVGRSDECVSEAHASQMLAEQTGQPYYVADVLRVKAMGLLCRRDTEGAREALQTSLALAKELGAEYVGIRSAAVAYASGLATKLHLPEFNCYEWVYSASKAGFGRAIVDFGRVLVRGAEMGGSQTAELLRTEKLVLLLLLSALRLNMNAYILLDAELKASGSIGPSISGALVAKLGECAAEVFGDRVSIPRQSRGL